MTVLWNDKKVELQGGTAWNRTRFTVLKQMNSKGKVVVVDEKQEKFLVPISDLELEPSAWI